MLVDIEVVGTGCIDLELGNYYELDPRTCDPQTKPSKDKSWKDIQLFIYGIKHLDSPTGGTILKGIQLYG